MDVYNKNMIHNITMYLQRFILIVYVLEQQVQFQSSIQVGTPVHCNVSSW